MEGRFRVFRKLCFWVVLVVCLAGCGSSRDDSVATGAANGGAASPNVFFFQGPQVAGQVTVTNSNGEVVVEGPALGGAATLPLPTDETVLAQEVETYLITFSVDQPETLGVGSGPATYLREVSGFTPNELVRVDEISSLIARYRQAHPNLTLEEATTLILQWLGLPIDGSDPVDRFDRDSFLIDAQGAGGVDTFLSDLVSEVDSPDSTGQRFFQPPVGLELTGIADKLANSLAGYAEGKAHGWLEGVIGINEAGIADALAAIEGLSTAIADLNKKITDLGDLLLYTQKDSVLALPRNKAVADTDLLAEWAADSEASPPTEAQIAADMTRIRNYYVGILNTVNEAELPAATDGQPGMAGLYLNRTAPRLFGGPKHEVATLHRKRSFDFQQAVLNLRVESLHYDIPSRLEEAEREVDLFFANARSQMQQYPLPFDEDEIMLDRQTNLYWSRKPIFLQVVNAEKAVDGFLTGFRFGNEPAGLWRLPTAAEYGGLNSAIGATGIDQHQNVLMKNNGFLPVGTATDIGDWGLRGDFQNSVLIAPIEWKFLSGAGGFINSASLIDVRNFRQKDGILLSTPRGSAVVAFYLVRQAPKVASITVSEDSRTSYSVVYKATARLTDGTDRDVTDLVRWSISKNSVAVVSSAARISNVPGSSGTLSFRQSALSGVQVKASYNEVVASVDAPALTFEQPAFTSLVVSPLRYHVPSTGYNQNLFELDLRVDGVRGNGQIFQVPAGQVAWTTDFPDLVTVQQASGRAIAKRPNARTTVTITAKVGTLTQVCRLVLEP
jgi:hypothetical protein